MTTALYRRYRPETFEDVIGQEHVTEPLMTALRKNRVNHAYLFSGPRGCGKTTSARILARCLNCAEGPTATPCGRCESCQDLARDGAGSLDVIEMDAASHGGVDHARDLRERATFAPVRDRYKIFIIDEAHMVTREGFNALLKIVEEPPEHVKFIFATTEPSKVLTTIRSRTHHYPFRLVPPEPLMRYLEQLCQEEGVTTEPGVLSLVVRAGGGSVRDSLSVLDQLMAGSDERGLTYDLAVALLGYTHAALLDDVVDAFAAGDAATVFSSVDRVIQTGQDPRRFVEDLLERFRDLVVVNAVPDSAANILHGMPTDQINRLRNQATQLGAAELSRSADITNEALNEMTGATSPQLHLELLCARILLPSADDTTRGITSRVDRLERRLSIPRGAGIRQGGQEVPAASGTAAAWEAAEPSDALAAHAPGAPEIAPVAPDASSGPDSSAAPAREPSDPTPSRPVRQDGSEPGRSAMSTPDIAEPSIPEDEAEEPQGSEHPAAGEPVPEGARGPQGSHPPADGTTSAPEATAQNNVSGQPRPGRERDASATDRPAGRDTAAAQAQEAAPSRQSDRTGGVDASASDVTSGELELLRSSWPEIVSALAEIRRVAWAITVRGTPISYENSTLRIAFEGDGDIMNFPRFEADVRAAIQNVVGLECAVEAVRPGDTRGQGGGADGPSAGPGKGPGGRGPAPRAPRGPSATAPSSPQEQPDYFREPEGFGVNRRRQAPSSDEAGHGSPQGPSAPPSRAGAGGQPAPQEPQPRGSRASDTAPPEDDEPVTSWSVAAIPQPGAESGESRTTSEPQSIQSPREPEPADSGSSSAPPVDSTSGAQEDPGTATGSDPRPGNPAPNGSDSPTGEPLARDGRGHRAPGAAATDGTQGTERAAGSEIGAAGVAHVPEPRNGGSAEASQDDDAPRPSPPGGGRQDHGPSTAPAHRPSTDRGPEYWSPEEPPPPPEDMYDEPGPSASSTSASASAAPSGAAESSPGRAGSPGAPRRGWRERHAAAIAAASKGSATIAPPSTRSPGVDDENFVPGADDESLEDSALYGKAAIERILGGMLIDERAHDTSQ
ncbi:DNA polymerase III subunit gamma and tau [Kocuria rhizophila]|uniref:DNA polymerase III subunit gamma and tau n=1 Tax=Kocuria rhizophila TaxID=72000 RepID=UPI001ABEB12D|nr:DNA polymerase III subunit gamma and tau [Kocuria rhizophila]MBO4145130.1 DNA polymerase III subunit gamma and tau [Kocuria rhizophila]QTK31815.1 DNA polymerase III subunit gamma and tau [Kocuria rhizophila]